MTQFLDHLMRSASSMANKIRTRGEYRGPGRQDYADALAIMKEASHAYTPAPKDLDAVKDYLDMREYRHKKRSPTLSLWAEVAILDAVLNHTGNPPNTFAIIDEQGDGWRAPVREVRDIIRGPEGNNVCGEARFETIERVVEMGADGRVARLGFMYNDFQPATQWLQQQAANNELPELGSPIKHSPLGEGSNAQRRLKPPGPRPSGRV